MRPLLAFALILLFLWLHRAQMTNDSLYGSPSNVVAKSKAAVSLLLSPLSLYSWLASLRPSILLLFAWPWCFANIGVTLLLTCFHVALYLLHMSMVVGVVAILTLTKHKMDGGGDAANKKVLKKLEWCWCCGHFDPHRAQNG
ncbi:hypothetical protein GBF38_003466 [Nibea albiflora]|uniref:Uncharacterized protein n=1 Tax=Nibea albiflora TaxID=240163 RepID=A0ACB7FKW1_NIBAL|nr:hypothetical protein GBF38_003466 [Nibea albiflora]